MNRALILFVHGLGGAGEATWRQPGRPGFRELILADEALAREFDVSFFEFPTSLFRLPFSQRAPGIRDLAEGLRSQLDNRFGRYEFITLVCHSLGGLIARKYLVEEVQNGRRLRVNRLLLFAVPNHGAGLASIANEISWRHNQLIQLSRNSEFVEELNANWARLDMSSVDMRYVVAGQDRVVDKHSAVGLWGNDRVDIILDADHRSVVKPSSRDDLAFLILRRFALGPANVFVSVGGGRTPHQDRFVESVYRQIRSVRLTPLTLDDYGAANTQPLTDVARRMDRCYGAVVIAFERTYIEKGVSRRDVPDRKKSVDGTRLPTVWNQIEAAIAYTRELPLLVLVEHGLSDEGMLESRYDWRVTWVDISQDLADEPKYRSIFEDWGRSVLERRGDP